MITSSPTLPRPRPRPGRAIARRVTASPGGEPTGPTPPSVTNLQTFVWCTRDLTIVDVRSGTAGAINAGARASLTKANAFPTAQGRTLFQFLTVSTGNALNRGTFMLTVNSTDHAVEFINASAVFEDPAGDFRTHGKVGLLGDQSPAGNDFAELNLSGTYRSLAIRDNLPGYEGRTLIASGHLDQQGRIANDGAMAALFNGTDPDYSMSCRIYKPSGTWSSTVLLSIDNVDGTSYIRVSTNGALGITITRRAAGSNAVRSVSVSLPVGSAFTLGVKFDHATLVTTVYVDGLPVATGAASASRTHAGMTRTIIGETGGSAAGIYFLGATLGNAAWSDAEFLAVHESFLEYEAADAA